MQGLQNMVAIDMFVPIQIGNRPRYPQHAVIAARGEVEFVGGLQKGLSAGVIGAGDVFQQLPFSI